ncbi:MAG: hypothetical protein MJE12_27625 [Alphaproteobacteria bacterium]|nr:hypothetical protein [Alphaproteobacteria bacterium]
MIEYVDSRRSDDLRLLTGGISGKDFVSPQPETQRETFRFDMEIARTTKRVLPTLTALEFVPIYFLFGVMVTYAVITPYLYAPHASDSRFIFVYALLSMIVLGGCRSGYDIGTLAFKIILRSTIGLCVVYIVASHVPVADVLVQTNP